MSDLVGRLRYGDAALYVREAADAIERKDAAIADFEESIESHNALVRKLDVLLNGEDGAAKQASLCDIVAQVAKENPRAAIAELVGALKVCLPRLNFANKHINCDAEIAIVNAAIAKYDHD